MSQRTRIFIVCGLWLVAIAGLAGPAGARDGCYPPPCAAPAPPSVRTASVGDLPSEVPNRTGDAAPALPVVAAGLAMLAGTLTVLCVRRRATLAVGGGVAHPDLPTRNGSGSAPRHPERSRH